LEDTTRFQLGANSFTVAATTINIWTAWSDVYGPD